MKTVVVRYETTPEAADENARLVEEVFEELNATDPGIVRYGTLRLEDGVSFVHIARFDDPEAGNPLGATEAFQRFQQGIAERCTQPPMVSDASLVGEYRLFA